MCVDTDTSRRRRQREATCHRQPRLSKKNGSHVGWPPHVNVRPDGAYILARAEDPSSATLILALSYPLLASRSSTQHIDRRARARQLRETQPRLASHFSSLESNRTKPPRTFGPQLRTVLVLLLWRTTCAMTWSSSPTAATTTTWTTSISMTASPPLLPPAPAVVRPACR